MLDTDICQARSWLFTPATRPERFAKAAEQGADVLIIDLEDAVAQPDKEQARQTAMAYICARAQLPLALRINALDTPAGIKDICALLECGQRPDYLILPKTEAPAHLQIIDRLTSLTDSNMRLIGMIESARGLNQVEAIVAATPKLAALMFGAADMAADGGTAMSWQALAYARAKMVSGCAMHGIMAIDAPFFNIQDEAGLRSETERALEFGFAAKAAIHPVQINFINTIFTPTAEQISRARSILYENAKGVGQVAGMMVDEALARQARRLLARAGFGN